MLELAAELTTFELEIATEVEVGIDAMEEEATATRVVGVGVAVEREVEASVRDSFTVELELTTTPAAELVEDEDFVTAEAALTDDTEEVLTTAEDEDAVATTFTPLEVF